MAVTITRESPRRAEISRLVEELDEYLGALYPAESNHLLDVETLARPEIRFFVARLDGEALGCGALRIDPTGYGEVKRSTSRPGGVGSGWAAGSSPPSRPRREARA